MKNSFIHPPHEFDFAGYKPEDVKEALDQYEKLTRDRIAATLGLKPKDWNFENTVLAITRASEEFERVCVVVGHLESVLGESWRKADELCNLKYSELSSFISFNKGLYKLLNKYADKNKDELNKQQKRLLDEMLFDYKLNGIDLDHKKRQRLKSINKRLSILSMKFGQNVVDDIDKSSFYTKNLSDLDGLSDSTISKSKENAEKQGKAGYLVNYSEPIYLEVSRFCKCRKTRHKFHKIKSEIGKRKNHKIVANILQLRQERASICGFGSYAELSLKQKMAKTPETVMKFVDELTISYRSGQAKEFEELKSFLSTQKLLPKRFLQADYETSYYWREMKESLYDIDDKKVKEFLPAKKVIDGLFAFYKDLYDIDFVSAKLPSWHGDVESYKLLDGERCIAIVYCDWFARPGKRGGAWMNDFFVADSTAAGIPHVGTVNANFPNDTDSLLSMGDVETAFHEFGHFIHLAFSTVAMREQGMSGCRWDFIEAPSQIMENFVWEPKILKKLTSHYRTGEPMPDELINKVIKSRNFANSTACMRQLNFASVDIRLHHHFNTKESDVVVFARDLKNSFAPVACEQYESNILAFSHIFAGGYAAGYYGYKWAEAIQTDLFSRFEEDGVMSKRVAKEYRDKILARGDEEEPEVLIEDFLGRPFNPKTMLRRDGVMAG